jgi:nitrate/nitrite transporter NarK
VRWSDRVFYKRRNGSVTSLSELWGRRQPGAVSGFVGLVGLLGGQTMRPALRWALAEKEASL